MVLDKIGELSERLQNETSFLGKYDEWSKSRQMQGRHGVDPPSYFPPKFFSSSSSSLSYDQKQEKLGKGSKGETGQNVCRSAHS